jgi:hypothetical protein
MTRTASINAIACRLGSVVPRDDLLLSHHGEVESPVVDDLVDAQRSEVCLATGFHVRDSRE